MNWGLWTISTNPRSFSDHFGSPCVCKGVGACVLGERFGTNCDGGFEGFKSSCSRLAQEGFDFGEGRLDWIEVRCLWRRQQGCACNLDDFAGAFELVGGLVAENDDIALAEGLRQVPRGLSVSLRARRSGYVLVMKPDTGYTQKVEQDRLHRCIKFRNLADEEAKMRCCRL